MDKKLRSLFLNQIPWRLLSRVAPATFALLLILWSGFTLWSYAIFFCTLLGVYYSLFPERVTLKASFWLLPIMSVLALYVSEDAGPFVAYLIAALFSVFFFVEIGTIQFFFKHRAVVYKIFHTGFFLGIFVLFFSFAESTSLVDEIFWFLAVFTAVFLLIREAFWLGDIARGRKADALGAAAGLLVAELSWLLRFLPLGFLNSAAFLTLFLLLMKDSVQAHLEGTLTPSFVFQELVVFILFSVIVLAASRWVI